MSSTPSRRPLLAALAAALCLSACGGGGSDTPAATVIPGPPKDLGFTDTAASSSAPPYTDAANFVTNQRGDARYATRETNAGVRVLDGFLAIWQPSTLRVDAGVSAPAVGSFPAVTASAWSGIPGDATDGRVLNTAVHAANIQYVIDATSQRTSAQELAAYLDDRRQKGYSITDGMGPLTAAWRAAAQQTTTITAIAADATTVKYDDAGNDNGVGGSANPAFGAVVDFVNSIGENGSTEPAKRFYKYARPWRWSAGVKVVPALEPAKSSTPATDGGYPSGHAAEAVRKALALAYVVPQRYQEMLARGLELGENRILAGMHSPLDVMSGRVQAQAVVAAALVSGTAGKPAADGSTVKGKGYQQAQAALMAAVGAATPQAFLQFAHSQDLAADRFADHAVNRANYLRRLTYGLAPIGDTTRPALVPQGAEVLLETRLPYLDAAQRRVVLKTTALPSGYPILDDAEGWGRLNLFAAADGYGAFNGDVTVAMDASLGGFHAADTWRNDIGGTGKLIKQGSGALTLAGNNRYSGGTHVKAGSLLAASATALGLGDVYLGGGSLVSQAPAALSLAGAYTQMGGSTLALKLGGGSAGRLVVGGTATLAGGTLNVSFAPGCAPGVGDLLKVISSGSLQGRFTTITVEGFKATPTYTATGLLLRIDG
ncbi:MAG TPA: phosphatase PAP2 family protein [Burkholderiaceae bacterium]|nr:phosphatase PAP2 family protein [Burkholderiaceae bacterium]